MKTIYHTVSKFITTIVVATMVIAPKANALFINYNAAYSTQNNSILYVAYKKRNSNYQNNTLDKAPLYNQNAGYDPAGWLLSGPGMDTAATALQRPYYESFGARNFEKNYIYYDWGW